MTLGLQVARSMRELLAVTDNTISIDNPKTIGFVNSAVTFSGNGNVLHIDDGVRLRGTRLRFLGDGSVVHLRASRYYTSVISTVYHDSVLYIGPNASFTSAARIVPSERKHVIIGADAMFSSRIAIRTADPHLIYSASTLERINPSASVWIGDHVWLGEDSLYLKGSRVGSGSIIAARAVATRTIPSNASAAGVPARVVSRDIVWTRPSVHTWTEEQTRRYDKHSGDDFVFLQDGTSEDLDRLEEDLDLCTDGAARAAWCRRVDGLSSHNRFAQAGDRR